MSENIKKIKNIDGKTRLSKPYQDNSDKDTENIQIIYDKIIKLINSTYNFMLGPEKNKTANFVAKNYEIIYEILGQCKKDHNYKNLGGEE